MRPARSTMHDHKNTAATRRRHSTSSRAHRRARRRPTRGATPTPDARTTTTAMRFPLRSTTDPRPILRASCPTKFLVSGIATAIGSLPHHDAAAAAALVLRCLPELARRARASDAHSARRCCRAVRAPAIDGIDVDPTERSRRFRLDGRAEIDATFDAEAHGGLLTFLDVAAPNPFRRVA